jgi:hypothetical protein
MDFRIIIINFYSTGTGLFKSIGRKMYYLRTAKIGICYKSIITSNRTKEYHLLIGNIL